MPCAVAVRRSRVAQLVAEGRIRARALKRATDNLDAYLAATQLGITISSLALGWIGAAREGSGALLAALGLLSGSQALFWPALEASMMDAQVAVMVANPADDVREGIAAFREKRTPVFKGR